MSVLRVLAVLIKAAITWLIQLAVRYQRLSSPALTIVRRHGTTDAAAAVRGDNIDNTCNAPWSLVSLVSCIGLRTLARLIEII